MQFWVSECCLTFIAFCLNEQKRRRRASAGDDAPKRKRRSKKSVDADEEGGEVGEGDGVVRIMSVHCALSLYAVSNVATRIILTHALPLCRRRATSTLWWSR
jgi:hypothetical protein